MKAIKNLIFILFLPGRISSSWKHVSKNNSNLDFDTGFCRSYANSKAPTYICNHPFMCSTGEISMAIKAFGLNKAEYNHCMHKKGYKQ